MRILLVEDDELLPDGLREGLGAAGFEMDHLAAAEPALDTLVHGVHDLAIVDLGLPGMDGLELVRRVRAAGVRTPILILTARDGLADRVQGLNEGADDYLVKPFAMPELLARVHALLRRSHAAASTGVALGKLRLDVPRREAVVDGVSLQLTAREWDLMYMLALAHPGVVPKRRIAESLGRWDREITDNAVEIYVSRLRAKLPEGAVNIRTVRGVGYRLDA